MSNYREELRSFIVETFLFGREGELQDSSSFLENGLIDSTGILELISFMEEKYGIEVRENELVPENLDSVNGLVGYLQRKLTAPPAAGPEAATTALQR